MKYFKHKPGGQLFSCWTGQDSGPADGLPESSLAVEIKHLTSSNLGTLQTLRILISI